MLPHKKVIYNQNKNKLKEKSTDTKKPFTGTPSVAYRNACGQKINTKCGNSTRWQ